MCMHVTVYRSVIRCLCVRVRMRVWSIWPASVCARVYGCVYVVQLFLLSIIERDTAFSDGFFK